MASDEGLRDSAPRSPVTAVGIDHVRLSYHYLDQGGIDGYLSLLHADVSLYLPSKQEICGREQIAAFQARMEGPAPEFDLMARIAGLRLRERWGGWNGEPCTATGWRHISVYERSHDRPQAGVWS